MMTGVIIMAAIAVPISTIASERKNRRNSRRHKKNRLPETTSDRTENHTDPNSITISLVRLGFL